MQALCTGGTLSAVLPSAPLPWPRVVALALPIARALGHAHAQGVIHRDLKPSNVLFGADGHVLVGDFGLARLVASAETTITATGTRLGSPEYWSPEQAAGEPVSEKTDLYALGCLLYQLATGALPFPPGEDRLAAGFRRIHEDPAPRPRRRARRAARGRGAPAAPPRRARRRPARVRPTSSPSSRAARRRPPARRPRAPPPSPRCCRRPRRRCSVPPPRRRWSRPPPPRPGFSATTGLVSLVLIGLGLVIAAVAAGTADRLDVRRDGIDTAARLTQDDARAGLGILLGAGLATFGLAVLAVWSVRAAGRGRRATTRALMIAVALLACAAAAAAVVWTAYAAGGDAGDLWRRASLG